MKDRISIVFFLLILNFCIAQEHAWVYFNDKPEAAEYLANPLTMLSQKALDRRDNQNISLDFKDVPVSENYLDDITNSDGINVRAKSKWMNALHVTGSEGAITALLDFAFVDHIEFAADDLNGKSLTIKRNHNKFEVKTDFDYGLSLNQIEMLNGNFLHEQNFTGIEKTIAVMDAGFPGVDIFTAFQKIRDNGQILGGYNFVDRNTNFYSGISHGSSVLSTMAGFVEGQLVGTAPDANYYLFITEDATQESPLEESLWVEAAEMADSLGVDIINTSLGYTTFDDSRYNYSYSDMDGNTAFISKGADIAFSRGMIIVNSAGNSGNNTWHYINAPADGHNVLAIGAVDGNEGITSFSSYGPSADGRIKPDVNAKGGGTVIINSQGNISTGNGTSFSSPIISGIVACLWQAYPDKTNVEIIQIIKESGHLYDSPNDHEGYGIPDFESSFRTLTNNTESEVDFAFYPNPFNSIIQFELADRINDVQISIFDVLGNKLLDKTISKQFFELSVNNLSSGVYVMVVGREDGTKSFKIIKN